MDAYPHELSGGMAQRVVIAIALVCSPHFIISDDATSGLDVTVQAQILDLMTDWSASRDNSMLFITRDVGITAHFCDRVAVIYAGEIMELAPRDAFFTAAAASLHHACCLRRSPTMSGCGASGCARRQAPQATARRARSAARCRPLPAARSVAAAARSQRWAGGRPARSSSAVTFRWSGAP